MTPRIQKKLRQPRSREPLHVTHRDAAGIDVHANVHWVAVAPEDAPPAPANHPPHLPAKRAHVGRSTSTLQLPRSSSNTTWLLKSTRAMASGHGGRYKRKSWRTARQMFLC